MKRFISFLLSILSLINIASFAIADDAARRLGDVNGDGAIDQYDYILVCRHYFDTFKISADDLIYADVNQDGNVDRYDYILLRRHYFGTFEITGTPVIPEVPIVPDIPDELPEGTVAIALIPDSKTESAMKANTQALQNAVDNASENGGGTLYIGAGTFHFASQGLNKRGNEEFVCMPKDNVTIIGSGEKTVLKPVGRSKGGLDMFYFNEYADSGFTNPQYLVNADCYDFVIDGELANADYYTSAGKGFMINLYKDCDWKNVTVMNTDGTGFGMDCPINCTIIDCKAYNCGKRATINNVGASGFGIGTGYCEEETILIDNCYAEGNKKFGIFFEHQGRFCGGRNYTAQKMTGFLIQNCTAKNNYIDFGGELAVDVTYKGCTVPADSTSTTRIAFTHHSIRCYVEDMNVETKFNDVTSTEDYYYDAVYWAVNKGITNGAGNNVFGVGDYCSVGNAITFLYRGSGYPGELRLTNTGESEYYENALIWAEKNSLIEGEYDMHSDCLFADFITFLWIYDGSKEAEGEYDFSVNWAISNGLIEELPGGKITREAAIHLLYQYFSNNG